MRRCVLAGVMGLATPQEAAAAAAAASSVAADAASGCTECNALVVPLPRSGGGGGYGGGGYGGGAGDDKGGSDHHRGEEVKLCPSTPGVKYVDSLPLKVPTAADGWCDDGDDDDDGAAEADGRGGTRRPAANKVAKERLPEHDAFAAFVVNAGSEVDVAFFDIVRAAAAGSGAQSA